uniref:Pyrin n=1 Tax=Catagonus wagneri TaxID=51154 RepID=A0A8C3W1Y3_9CETA
MAKTPSDHLLYSLEELVPYDFEKFKFKLQNTSLEKEHSRIPRGQLQTAQPVKLATLLVNHYGEDYAVQLTLQVLRAINQHLLAEELRRAISPEYKIQENSTDGSATSCFSGESKPESLKILDGLDGDKQRQSADGASCPASIQAEAGKGPQKKSQAKRRDQKGSEGPDVQSKPGPRNATVSARRSPLPNKPQGDRGSKPGVSLRRNASSAGRLQGLAGGSPTGSLGRREFKISEAPLPSEKKRPKSLELTISLGETEPLPPEALLLHEKLRRENPGLATIPSGTATLNVCAPVAPEKGSRNLEQSMTLQGGALTNTLSKVPLAGKKKSCEHPESTAPSEKKGTEAPETSETVTETAGGVLHEPSTPQVPPSSGRKGPQTPEDSTPSLGTSICRRLQKEAVCPLCRTQEGDPVGGSCAHNPCSSSAAPEADPEASHGRPPSCRWCQDLFPGKSCGSHDPNSLPQCERHTKQVQLLFCEDHGEPICLICGLSQAHRGHRVRPIGEAAREYKEKIQKQLEHLKELRKSGEKQRSQGPKKTANFLKQAETQKQKVHCQLQQLCQFLEQQEQLFGTWLDELGQIADHVRKTYGTQVTRDIASLDELIGELEAKQCQPEWELMKDIRVTLHRAKMVTVPELRATPPEVKEKIHLLYQKSEFVEKSMKIFSHLLFLCSSETDWWSGTLRRLACWVPVLSPVRSRRMTPSIFPECGENTVGMWSMDLRLGILILSAVDVILEAETAHPSLIFHLL